MGQHRARAGGQIAFGVVVWSSCLPVVSACDSCDSSDSSDSSSRTTIGIIAASLVIFCVICGGVCLRRWQLRRRVVRLSHVPYDGMEAGRSSDSPKPHSAPVPGGYPMYHQATSPAPPPVYMPQYPPHGYDTHHSHSRPQSTAIPEPTAPVSPASMRAPSDTTPRPISTLGTTSHSPWSSVRREEPTRIEPPPPSSPSATLHRSTQTNSAESPLPPLPSSPPPPSSPSAALPRNAQTNVAESPLPSLPSSPPPGSPSVVIAPASAPSPRPSRATALLNAAHPSALTPMHTGTSNNIEESPPAYTPI